jgi:hypothetical protein
MYAAMWHLCTGGVGCTSCCAMSAAIAQSSCNQVCTLILPAHASTPPVKTLKQTQSSGCAALEAVAFSSQAVGENVPVLLGHGQPII